jgi:4-amino-4-deoxy-L-arabinose transferase-like glycosyltransferase
MAKKKHNNKIYFTTGQFSWVVFFLLIFLGIGIRLYDLTDLPLDFHPTRQLLSAHKARGIYYQVQTGIPDWQREFAVQQWKVRAAVEPEVLEHLVAFTYQYIGEKLWVARIYSTLFWIIGGGFLFLLAKKLFSEIGALAALAIYLFNPYGIIASRSFQPDPLMVMLIIMFWWAVWNYSELLPATTRGGKIADSYSSARLVWPWALLAGVLGGIAIYIKFVAAFFVIGGGLGTLLGRQPLRRLLTRLDIWIMVGLGIIPGLSYIIYGTLVQNYLSQQFGGRFFPALFLDLSYYLGWVSVLDMVIGGTLLMAALLGLFFVDTRSVRQFLAGLWIAYLCLGLYFNYHISTHDYYSLPLIPIAALSAAPFAVYIFKGTNKQAIPTWKQGLLAGGICLGVFFPIWNVRAQLKSEDYRPEEKTWNQIGSILGSDAKLVALTQDYGMRLAYWGWLAPVAWPSSGDIYYHSARGSQVTFDEQFERLTRGQEYFLVTDFDEYHRQPQLAQKLNSEYQLLYEGDGYAVFDLLETRTP